MSHQDCTPLVMDMGPGTMGALQKVADPSEVNVVFSHLHPDHCLDFPAMIVWRRYSPAGCEPGTIMRGPADTSLRLGSAAAEVGGEIDDFSDIINLTPWEAGQTSDIGGFSVSVDRVFHPPESYGIRVEAPNGPTLTYSGDTAYCSQLVELAHNTDVLLCEATWPHEGDYPEGLHMSGYEAGKTATEAGAKALILTHIPPWTDRDVIVAEARTSFSGPVRAAVAGEKIQIG